MTDTEKLDLVINEQVEKGVLCLNSLFISKQYPKTHAKLASFIMDDVASARTEEIEETVGYTLLYAPRTVCYDFFDANNVFINTIGKEFKWTYSIDRIKQGQEYPTRVKAEHSAFMEAFAWLEKTL